MQLKAKAKISNAAHLGQSDENCEHKEKHGEWAQHAKLTIILYYRALPDVLQCSLIGLVCNLLDSLINFPLQAF